MYFNIVSCYFVDWLYNFYTQVELIVDAIEYESANAIECKFLIFLSLCIQLSGIFF